MHDFYILNESTDRGRAGDVSLFSSLEKTLLYTEAIDVRNGEYFCFISDGREVSLSAMDDYGPVSATIEASPRHQAEVESILRSFLIQLVQNGAFDIAMTSIEDARLTNLIGLVPRSLIT